MVTPIVLTYCALLCILSLTHTFLLRLLLVLLNLPDVVDTLFLMLSILFFGFSYILMLWLCLLLKFFLKDTKILCNPCKDQSISFCWLVPCTIHYSCVFFFTLNYIKIFYYLFLYFLAIFYRLVGGLG